MSGGYEWVYEYGGGLGRHWYTIERNPHDETKAYGLIVQAGPWAGIDHPGPYFVLSFGGERRGVYGSLDDAQLAAEDPSAVEPLRQRD